MTSTRLWRPVVLVKIRVWVGCSASLVLKPGLGHSYWRILVYLQHNTCQGVWQICQTITLLKSLIKTRMTSISVTTYKEQQPTNKLSITSTFVCYSRVTSCDFPKWRACSQAKRTTTFLNQFTLHYPVGKHLLFLLLHSKQK